MKSTQTPNNSSEVNNRVNDNLFQYFYLFGIAPECLDVSDFTNNLFEKNFKKVELLTQFPPYKRNLSYVDPDIIMNHCFPKGYRILEKEKWPNDEYFFFSFNNLYKFSSENKKIYFTAVIIFECAKTYLEMKYNNKTPPLPKYTVLNEKKEKVEKVANLEHIFIQKALCFSSFVPFPFQSKALIGEILEYIRDKEIIIPIEKLIEGIIFGIPRPVRAFFYISSKKNNELIPKQKQDIDFCLREFNQYNFYSYAYQYILVFTVSDIFLIYKCILLEIPVLFFSGTKEILTNIVETFINILSPLEYQYPHVSILPDSYCALIEKEKSYVFGINHRLIFKKIDKERHPTYFINMHLNVENKLILLCDIDERKVFQYCNTIKHYHVVNFEDLGKYADNSGNSDTSQCISKNIYADMITNVIEINLPEKITNTIIKDLSNYAVNNDKNLRRNPNYSEEFNQKIGEEYFYNYLTKLLNNYYSYLYNDEENIKKIINKEILNKKEEDIVIENLFQVNQFLHDNKIDSSFYSQFFKTRIFKNFIIRKYLNDPLDRYQFLFFDEKLIEKKNKRFFSSKTKTEFLSSKIFKMDKNIYQIKKPNNFLEKEITYMKSHKDTLLKKYFQNFGQYNKIKYNIFPKLVYDNKFFTSQYVSNIELSGNIVGCLKGYQTIENSLKNEPNPYNFFNIYTKDPMNRYLVDLNKIDIKKEVLNSLHKLWVYIFCLTFYYCDEIEKYFRFEELMRFLPRVDNEQKELFPIILMSIKEYGDENMLIKLFESMKNTNYTEYCFFCTKFKGDSTVKWDIKKIDTISSKLEIKYFRESKSDENKLLSEVKDINYDISSLQKRTFSSKNNNASNKEKITFKLSYKCNNCGQSYEMSNLAINLDNKVKSSLMICDKCHKYMEPTTYVVNNNEKIEFTIFSLIKLLNIVKEITMEYGQKIDLDELRTKYTSFFWNCILYFFLGGLTYGMLLKYKSRK